MDSKKIFGALVFVLIFVSFACAITGTIGNARMILRMEEGESLEKYVLVRNTNDVPVNINVSVFGELEDDIELIDDYFRLEPGDEKRAYFIVRPTKTGTTETKISIQFEAVGEKGGVGLSSTVIVITSPSGSGENYEEEDSNEANESFTSNRDDRTKSDGFSLNKISGFVTSGLFKEGSINISFILMLLFFCFILLVILLMIIVKTKPKREVL